jgi:tRNA(Ile)-lysidine synthase
VSVVRPLLAMRREEVRRLLTSRGIAWREDSSNRDPRFTRTRIRHGLLPLLERVVGREGIENLHAFGQAIERLEGELAAATAHLGWSPPPYRHASRGPLDPTLGGVLARAELMRVASSVRRRALCRLVKEGTGRAPGPRLLDRLARDVGAGRCTRHALPGGWTLLLRPRELHLLPPAAQRALDPGERRGVLQPWLPFPESPEPASARERAEGASQVLAVPGQVRLSDGRRIAAELVHAAPEAPVRGGPLEVELDAEGLPASLSVRWPRPGDRVRGLGAPGSKRLTRFLADRGIPREERRFVPLVSAGGEILWVTGVGPTEARRVGPETRHRLRLSLHHDCPPVDRAGWGGLSAERSERVAPEVALPFELGA